MAGQGVEDTKQLLDTTSSVRHKTRATYDTLIRQSRKLGQTATKTVSDASQGARQIFRPQPNVSETPVSNIEELKQVVAHSHEEIAHAKTILPFIFRDEITLDRSKITIIKRVFFWSSDVISIRVQDILNVSASVGPMFGSVTIASRVMSTVDHFEVDGFWRSDAIRITRILEGYMIARQNGVDTDHLSCKELADTLYEIGPAK